jgi:hypothetical protein
MEFRHRRFEGDLKMRIANVIFVGSVAALAVVAGPALSKSPTAQKTDERSTSSSCHAYQQAADGSWTALPCQETGAGGQPQPGTQPNTQSRSAAKSPEDESR